MIPSLDSVIGDSRALNLVRTCDGEWQASLEIAPGSWRVRVSATAEQAVRELQLTVPTCPVVASA